MSNLNSVFDIFRGWPDASALEASFDPDTGVIFTEGTLVYVTTRQLPPAKVLRIVDDSLTTAPTLGTSDRGKAYQVAGTGGAWSSFAVGDIVEWDGSAWNLIVAQSSGHPPYGTRAVVVEASAAGSFAGGEEKPYTYTQGTPDAWVAGSAPVNGNRIKITGTDSVYENKYYDYTGTHPGGAWYKAARQMEAPALIKALTSGIVASAPKDHAWVVIQGNDQYDSRFVNRVTCLKCASGAILKVATTIADTLSPGDLVCANAGALQKLTSGVGMEWPIGQVLLSNGTSGSSGWVVLATY